MGMIDDEPDASSGIQKQWRSIERYLTEVSNSSVSSPIGRAFILRIIPPVVCVITLATCEIFRIYDAARAQAELIKADNLPLSPSNAAPALIGGILGIVVIVLFVGLAWEVATARRITEVPRLAVRQFSQFITSAHGRLGRTSATPEKAAPPLPLRLAEAAPPRRGPPAFARHEEGRGAAGGARRKSVGG
jgi:hypothetical protein